MGTSNRRPYETAATLNQDLLDECQDNLTCRLEMIATIYDVGSLAETLRISDRAKYVGQNFYYPRVQFPIINRTIGLWLSNELEFDNLTLTINNSDSEYSHLLPGGSDYDGFIGRRVVIEIGLAEEASTYQVVFDGEVTDIAGFQRDTSSFTLVCRNKFDTVNKTIPNQVFIADDWPDIEDDFIGLGAPIVYGDWTTSLRPEAPEVPAFPVNGANADVLAGTEDLRCVISSTPIKTLDTTTVTLLRGDTYYIFDSADIAIVPASDNQVFDITQQNLTVDGNPWIYASGDQIFVKCVGVDLSGYDDNIVWQARDMLIRFGGLSSGDFDSSFATYRDKSTPSQSSISTIKSRIWLQESTATMQYVLSMLEQVRLEVFVNRSNLFAISSLHFEDFDASPATKVKNWDVIRDSFLPSTEDRNCFNRAKADYAFSPATGQASYGTGVYRNQTAVTQWGREISKLIAFPNLYIESDVINQLTEILRLASCNYELIEAKLTWRFFLKDLSDNIELAVQIGSIDYINVAEPVTGLIRDIGYDPAGLIIPVKILSLQMVPFPGSTKASVSGITGGYNKAITLET
jgi:hypothetical protein